MILASGAVMAQECIGFWENDIASGGTNGATSVFAADINGDGRIDVLSASYNDDTIAWYEASESTPPQYTQRVISTDADGVAAVYAVDIDGDGDMDVLAASPYDDTIALYENLGSGTPVFGRQVISSNADHALDVFAVDVDGDGDIDVLSANFVDNEIAWYENPVIENPVLNPDGGSAFFVKHVVSSSVYSAASVFAIDMDGDGDTDVLSASLTGDTVFWHEAELGVEVDDQGVEHPAILFTEHIVTAGADGVRSVFAADMDSDGDPDVLSASISDNKIAWHDNLRVTYCDDLTTPCDVDSDCDSDCLADPDSDGDPDCLNDLDSDGDEDGFCDWRFTTHTISNTAEGAKSIYVTNINDDPYPDVLAASEGNDTVVWYENSGGAEPSFVEHIVSSETESADAVFAADLDSDGDLDILSASSVPGSVSSSDKIAWFENSGAAAPWTERIIAETAEGANALFVAEIDGDIDTDGYDFELVAATSGGKVLWYEIEDPTPEQPEFTFTRHLISDNVPGATSVYVADLDSDGDEDVVAASSERDRVLWFANDSLGNFGPAQVITSDAVSVESVFVVDVDGDGNPDVLSASSGDDKIAWYRSDGLSPPGFTERIVASGDSAESPYVTVSAKSVFAADINSDGNMDILSASSGDDKIAWFENDGAEPLPGFVERIIASDDPSEAVYRADGASSVSAADIDSDGDLDILEASANSAIIVWYENRIGEGDPSGLDFIRFVVATQVFQAVFVSAADVDGDGDMDVLSTSLGDDNVAWYENDIVSDSDSDGDTDGTTDSDGPSFTRHVVDSSGENPRTVLARDLTRDGNPDLFAGFRFESAWFEQIGERCGEFDVNDDGVMNGIELAWIGRAFGLTSDCGADPPAWWCPVDYNGDGLVDGDDLSILATSSVWGETTLDCSFTCR
jgi:hypothetical protein